MWLLHTHAWIIVTTCYYWPDYCDILGIIIYTVTQLYRSAILAYDSITVSTARTVLSYITTVYTG